MKAIEAIDSYFKSGNDVPVTRATIKVDEWEEVKKIIGFEMDKVFYLSSLLSEYDKD